MKRALYLAIALLLMVGAFLAGSWRAQREAAPSVAGARRVLYYVDPMHPAYKSDKPGFAPDCGMELVPVYEDGSGEVAPVSRAPDPSGTLHLAAEKQELAGVRVSAVERTFGTRVLRLLGKVAADETRVYKLNAGIEGYFRDVASVTTGEHVSKDQLLATFSGPASDLVVQTFILSLEGADRAKQTGAAGPVESQSTAWNLRIRVQQLANLGMSASQIDEVQRSRELPEAIRVLAPADGFVLARNASPGLKFERGAEWYRIADLSRVWILADAFEVDAQYLRPGARARVSLPGQQRTFPARVAEIPPQFDAATRTLRVRLEAGNPGFALRPDMFVDVELPVTLPRALSVPVDALLDCGLKQSVFVDRGNGVFEARPVLTGWRFGDRVEIVKGLAPGERIVVSGAFLLDSESRMRRAAALPGAPGPDAGCGAHSSNTQANPAGPAGIHADTGEKQAADLAVDRDSGSEPSTRQAHRAPGHGGPRP